MWLVELALKLVHLYQNTMRDKIGGAALPRVHNPLPHCFLLIRQFLQHQDDTQRNVIVYRYCNYNIADLYSDTTSSQTEHNATVYGREVVLLICLLNQGVYALVIRQLVVESPFKSKQSFTYKGFDDSTAKISLIIIIFRLNQYLFRCQWSR